MKEIKDQILECTKDIKSYLENLNDKESEKEAENIKKTSEVIKNIGDKELLDEYKKIELLLKDKNIKSFTMYDKIVVILNNVEKILENKKDLLKTDELNKSIKQMKEKFSRYTTAELEKLSETYVKLFELAEKLNNEKIKSKLEGLAKIFTEKGSLNLNQAIEQIENFEKSVEKNITIEEYNNTAEKLNKDDEKSKAYAILENYKNGLMCKDVVTTLKSHNELIHYALSLPKEEGKKLLEALDPLHKLFSSKSIINLTEQEIEETTKLINNVEKVIDSLKIEKPNENILEKPIPESLEDIKNEMDSILGAPLLNGIENIDLKDEKYDILIEAKKEKLTNLKEKIKLYQIDKDNNKNIIEKQQLEMYLILEDLYNPYEINKDLIESLEVKDKERFEKLKIEFDKKVKKEILERKEKEKLTTPEKIEEELTEREQKFINNDKFLDQKIKTIREEMAEILYGKDSKDKVYDGIENTDINHLDDAEKQHFEELREELLPLLAKKSKRVQRKGKLVKFKKSAIEFYKKHKKAIWFAAGIAIFAISLPHLLPSVMYLNSALWHTAVAAGVPANAGIPVLLHDVNTIIGANIGATFASGTGIWTLANGAALNATVAEAGILASLGRLALIATPFVGAKIAIKNISGATSAIKNAVKKAKEKIKQRKEKIEEETPEKKGHFFKNIKDYAKNKFKNRKRNNNLITEDIDNEIVDEKENVSTKINNTKENIIKKYTEIKENREAKKDEKNYEKEKKYKNKIAVSMLKQAYNIGLIDEVTLINYLEADPDETLRFLKESLNKESLNEEKERGSK